ncbi:hypothetical protein D3C87_797520 [compost metagenome]
MYQLLQDVDVEEPDQNEEIKLVAWRDIQNLQSGLQQLKVLSYPADDVQPPTARSTERPLARHLGSRPPPSSRPIRSIRRLQWLSHKRLILLAPIVLLQFLCSNSHHLQKDAF